MEHIHVREMHVTSEILSNRLSTHKRNTIFMGILGTILLGISFVWNFYQIGLNVEENAVLRARAAFEKDVFYSQWNSRHGGIYVEVDEHVQPNVFLDDNERDIQTSSRGLLTLVNPAYMNRLVNDIQTANNSIHSHITSLRPIRPENAADPWETQALKSLEAGKHEVNSIESLNGKPHMRVMRSLAIENSCLKCHAKHGYKLGDVRGGISVSVPMEPLWLESRTPIGVLAASHVMIWLLGMTVLLTVSGKMKVKLEMEQNKENALLESEQRYRQMFEGNRAVKLIVDPDSLSILDANQAAADFYGYDRSELKQMKIGSLNTLPIEEILEQTGKAKNFHQNYFLFKHKTKSGDIRDVEVYSSPFDLKDKKVLYSIVHDVTDRKRTERELSEAEEKYRSLFAGVRDSIIVFDQQTFDIVDVNDAVINMYGYAKDELLKMKSLDFSTDPEESLASYKQSLTNDCTGVWNRLHKKKDGSVFPVEISRTPIEIKGRKLFCGIIRDVTTRVKAENELKVAYSDMERRVADRTAQLRKSNVELEFEIQERKNAEETAKTSETMLKAILSASPVGIGMESPDREILWVNEAWLAIFGFENEKDCVGLNARDFYAYKSAYDLTEKAMFENGTSTKVLQMDAAMLRRDGSTFDAHLRIGAIDIGNAERGLIVTVTDVSDRKKYEKALVESESKYRTLFESAGDAIYILSMDAETQGSIISANHQAAEMHGYTLPELLELNISDLDSSESAQHIKNRMERLLEGGVVREVTTHRRKDGSIFPIELNARKMEIAGKNYVLAIDRDVTEREMAHEALLASERKMRMINDSSPIGIRVVQDNKYVYVNPAFAQMFGYNDQDEILGLSVELLYAEESRPLILERQQSRSEGKIIPSHYEAVGITKNGVPFEVEAWGTEIDYLGRAASLAFVVNVSETRSLRSQLFRAQKLEAVGTLAGGIAHDFNNILQVTLGYSDLMLREEDLSQRSKDDIQKIHEAARKGAELVKGLLTFSRKTEFSPRPINLNQRINDCRKMIERTLPKMIEIQLSLADDLLTVNADPNRIDQILMNLAVNARDAMPEGGKLIFTTENVCWTEESASRPPELIPGDYVVLHVTDNGIGMSAQTVDRIFEPFFTTKGVGEGTGLGLATVYGIVQQHGGHIQCRSDLGHGTTFTLYFPSIKREREEYCETSGSQIPVGGSETILLVDDEELIRELGAKILKRAGYKVMTASDGMQALETYSHSKESIALVLLDLMMPRMGGKQCLDILLRFDSNIKVVIASGFSSGSEIKDSLERGAKAFVRKPYDGYEILQIIRKVLDERL